MFRNKPQLYTADLPEQQANYIKYNITSSLTLYPKGQQTIVDQFVCVCVFKHVYEFSPHNPPL